MTVTPSRYSRAEASFARQRTGDPPIPSPPLRPLWQDVAAGALLAVFIAALVFI